MGYFENRKGREERRGGGVGDWFVVWDTLKTAKDAEDAEVEVWGVGL